MNVNRINTVQGSGEHLHAISTHLFAAPLASGVRVSGGAVGRKNESKSTAVALGGENDWCVRI